MSPSELRDYARKEIDQLGPEPAGPELELWREERWGAIVLLAGLADDNSELLRAVADEIPGEWAIQPIRELLLDAAQLAEIGA